MFFLLCQILVRKVTNRPIITGPADKPSRHCEISLLKSLVCWWLAWFNNSSSIIWMLTHDTPEADEQFIDVYSIPRSFSLNQHCQHSFIWLSLQYFKNLQHLVVFMCFSMFFFHGFHVFFPYVMYVSPVRLPWSAIPCLPSDIDPEDPIPEGIWRIPALLLGASSPKPRHRHPSSHWLKLNMFSMKKTNPGKTWKNYGSLPQNPQFFWAVLHDARKNIIKKKGSGLVMLCWNSIVSTPCDCWITFRHVQVSDCAFFDFYAYAS